ncbi:hypothetical protein V491_06483 [Pseudogymnoascus sp. VKM F-3775]|nr:hypothetical protein V491_06483 [Pseudogymnoascus sp. VKM F-3775]
MVRKRGIKAQELDILVHEAIIGVKSGKYKSAYAAAKAFGLRPNTVSKRIQGGSTRQEARQKQQLLSTVQEKTLLKWTKELTISGYAPSHRVLREVADEVRTNRRRVYQSHLQTQQPQQPQIPRFPLGQSWLPQFIKRHPHLRVKLGRRVEAQRMNGATKDVLGGGVV